MMIYLLMIHDEWEYGEPAVGGAFLSREDAEAYLGKEKESSTHFDIMELEVDKLRPDYAWNQLLAT